jgi:hypothetical protein
MEFPFQPNDKSLSGSKETIGFSRMESPFQPKNNPHPNPKDTIGFASEFPFHPKNCNNYYVGPIPFTHISLEPKSPL